MRLLLALLVLPSAMLTVRGDRFDFVAGGGTTSTSPTPLTAAC